MNATGRPHWFSVAETQTSDASHSTTNGWLSSMDWSLALSSSFFSRPKADRADYPVGRCSTHKRLYLVREVWYPLRIVSKHVHYSTERADICRRRIVLEEAKSLLIWFDDAITHTVTKYVDRCLRFHRLGFVEGKTSQLNCCMELLHIFIMFLLVSPCYCNVVQIWEGVLESFLFDHLVHRSLEHGNSIGHTKRYTTELVESPIGFKTCVLPIRLFYWHLVLSTFEVKC